MSTSRSIQRDRLAWLLAVGITAASWAMVPLPSLAFGLPKLTILAFTVSICLMSVVLLDTTDIVSWLWNGVAGRLFCLFFLLVMAASLWSSIPVLSLIGAAPRYEGILTWLLYGGIAMLGLLLVRDKHSQAHLVSGLVVSNIGVVAYGLLQLLGLDPLAGIWGSEVFLGRVFSTLGHPNTLGLYIVLTLPFLYHRSRQSKPEKKRIWIGLFLLNVVVLLATVSRASIVGLGVSSAAALLWGKGKFRRVSPKQWGMMAGIAAALCLLGLVFAQQRFSLEMAPGRSVDSRLIIWDAAADMISNWPIGYGPETMGVLSGRFLDLDLLAVESLTTRIDRAHSQPLDLMLSFGLLAPLLFYGLLYSILAGLWQKKKSGTEGSLRLAGMMSLLGAAVTTLFGFHSLMTGAVFWLVLGMMLGLVQAPSRRKPIHPLLNTMVMTSMMLMAVTLTVVCLQWTRARMAMDRAEQWFSAGQLSSAVAEYAQAVQLFPPDRIILTRAIETNLYAQEYSNDPQERAILRELTNAQLSLFDRMMNSKDGMVYLLSAWQQGIDADDQGAEWMLLQAAMHQPDSITGYRIAAHVFQLLGNDDQLHQIYDRMIEVLPSAWMQPDTPAGRILWKEHPWLQDVYDYAVSTN